MSRKRLRRRWPMNSWKSARVNGVVSEGVLVYSPGRIRKKKAMVSMSVMAMWSLVPTMAAALVAWMMTKIGMGLT